MKRDAILNVSSPSGVRGEANRILCILASNLLPGCIRFTNFSGNQVTTVYAKFGGLATIWGLAKFGRLA